MMIAVLGAASVAALAFANRHRLACRIGRHAWFVERTRVQPVRGHRLTARCRTHVHKVCTTCNARRMDTIASRLAVPDASHASGHPFSRGAA